MKTREGLHTLIAMKLSDTEIKRHSKEKLGFNQGSGGNGKTNMRNLKLLLLLLLLLLLQLLLVVVSEKSIFTCAGSLWLSCAHNFLQLKKAFGGSRQALPTIFWLSTADDDDDDDDDAARRASNTVMAKSESEQRPCGKHQKQVLFVYRLLARPHPSALKSLNLGRYLKVHSHLVLGTLVLSPLTSC
jgi:hypothetical protein